MNVEQVLLNCRFSKRYEGYRELKDCVEMALEEEERLLYVSRIYYDVGKKHHISASGVERNIRTLLSHVWKNGGQEALEELSGGKLYEKPTVSELIEILVCHMKHK